MQPGEEVVDAVGKVFCALFLLVSHDVLLTFHNAEQFGTGRVGVLVLRENLLQCGGESPLAPAIHHAVDVGSKAGYGGDSLNALHGKRFHGGAAFGDHRDGVGTLAFFGKVFTEQEDVAEVLQFEHLVGEGCKRVVLQIRLDEHDADDGFFSNGGIHSTSSQPMILGTTPLIRSSRVYSRSNIGRRGFSGAVGFCGWDASSCQRFWLSHVAGLGIYWPSSFVHCGVVFR